MADEDWYKPHRPPVPPRQPKAGELLFEFVRASDRAPMSCELRFHGESYGWEAQFLERGELLFSRGGLSTQPRRLPTPHVQPTPDQRSGSSLVGVTWRRDRALDLADDVLRALRFARRTERPLRKKASDEAVTVLSWAKDYSASVSAPAPRSRTSPSCGRVVSFAASSGAMEPVVSWILQDDECIVKTASMPDEATAIRISRVWLRKHGDRRL